MVEDLLGPFCPLPTAASKCPGSSGRNLRAPGAGDPCAAVFAWIRGRAALTVALGSRIREDPRALGPSLPLS